MRASGMRACVTAEGHRRMAPSLLGGDLQEASSLQGDSCRMLWPARGVVPTLQGDSCRMLWPARGVVPTLQGESCRMF